MSTSRGGLVPVLALVAVLATLPGGCFVLSQNIRMPPQLNGPPVAVRQYSPPTQKLPAALRTLSVACFGGASETDRRYAAAVAAATAERLAGNLQDFPRYGMVLRGSAEDLLGEPPAGEASTETAADLGRRAGADAVVTGNVAVGNQRGRLELDVQFALVAAADGRVVDSWGYKTRYEPAPQGPRGAERSVTLAELIRQGPSGDLARPSAAPTAGEVLPREAAAAYAPRITPHWSVLRIPLAGGGGQFGDAARTAAAGGRGLEALLNFRRSAVRDPRDPGAWYNIAVMYESLGQWPHAQEAYRKAVDIYETAAFRRGLQRVERELARQAEAPVPGG